MAGVFLGSIGFPVIYTLWKHYWHVRRWTLHAKLTLITTVALFFAGAAAFLVLEYNNPKTFGAMDAWDTTFQAFFLSAMTRSGGFSVVDIGELLRLVARRRLACSCSSAAARRPRPAASR